MTHPQFRLSPLSIWLITPIKSHHFGSLDFYCFWLLQWHKLFLFQILLKGCLQCHKKVDTVNAIQVYDRRLCGAKVCRVNAPVMDTTTLLTRSGDGSRDGQSNTTRSREALCHRSTLTLSAWSFQRLQRFDVMRVQGFSSWLSQPMWVPENEIL